MCDVYANAYVNIAASALPNSSGSFFQDRVCYSGPKNPDWKYNSAAKRNRRPIDSYTQWVANDTDIHCPVTVRYSMDRAHRHLCGEAEHKHGAEEPLLDRAWVFRERMLSRRTVYIFSSEVLWECRSWTLCECGGIDKPMSRAIESWELRHIGPSSYHGPNNFPSSKKAGMVIEDSTRAGVGFLKRIDHGIHCSRLDQRI